MIKIITSYDDANYMKNLVSILTELPGKSKKSEAEMDEDIFKRQIRNQESSRVIEAIFNNTTASVRTKLFDTYIKDELLTFCKHPIANYVVQCYIRNITDEDKFIEVAYVLRNDFLSLLSGRSGVILEIVEKATLFPETQADIIQSLYKALSKKKDKKKEEILDNIAKLCLKMDNIPVNTFKKNKERNPSKFSTLGCRFLQSLFNYDPNYSTAVIMSFVSLDEKILLQLCSDKIGSRVIDMFAESLHVKIKYKLELIQKLKGNFAELAMDKISSHCLEKLYLIADLSLKETIVKELVPVQEALSQQYHGKFVIQKCQLSMYISNKKSWRKNTKQKQKRREMFDDIVETQAGKKKRKKMKKEEKKRKREEVPEQDKNLRPQKRRRLE
eukprot:TRINITY_DN5805_c0_g1_i2.p1 TRINITY_DN5805_c0_g1~~TRINITY_DN5805_c0_g1_i2.p1  ORF type:complete len:386 (-),score=95.06 TRINITY_DN5805_c0_g1_i2:41-1198(-)